MKTRASCQINAILKAVPVILKKTVAHVVLR